jgi:hypothetical protein
MVRLPKECREGKNHAQNHAMLILVQHSPNGSFPFPLSNSSAPHSSCSSALISARSPLGPVATSVSSTGRCWGWGRVVSWESGALHGHALNGGCLDWWVTTWQSGALHRGRLDWWVTTWQSGALHRCRLNWWVTAWEGCGWYCGCLWVVGCHWCAGARCRGA